MIWWWLQRQFFCYCINQKLVEPRCTTCFILNFKSYRTVRHMPGEHNFPVFQDSTHLTLSFWHCLRYRNIQEKYCSIRWHSLNGYHSLHPPHPPCQHYFWNPPSALMLWSHWLWPVPVFVFSSCVCLCVRCARVYPLQPHRSLCASRLSCFASFVPLSRCKCVFIPMNVCACIILWSLLCMPYVNLHTICVFMYIVCTVWECRHLLLAKTQLLSVHPLCPVAREIWLLRRTMQNRQ